MDMMIRKKYALPMKMVVQAQSYVRRKAFVYLTRKKLNGLQVLKDVKLQKLVVKSTVYVEKKVIGVSHQKMVVPMHLLLVVFMGCVVLMV